MKRNIKPLLEEHTEQSVKKKAYRVIITAWLIMCLVYTSTSLPYQVQAAAVGKVTGVYTQETVIKDSDKLSTPQLWWKPTKKANGYQLRVFNVATGKKIGKDINVEQSDYPGADLPAIPDLTFCKLRVRAYQLSDNKKSYGPWHTVYYSWDRFHKKSDHHVSVKKSANSPKLTLSWDKVKGATNYTVLLYVSQSNSVAYLTYKVGTTTKTKMSFSKAGNYNLVKDGHYIITVTPNYKLKGKTYKGEDSYCFSY